MRLHWYREFRVRFSTRVAGIPCSVDARVTPAYPGGLFEPPTPSKVEFVVLDRSGARAEWLRRKLTDDDISRIEKEAFEAEREKRESV